MTVSGKRNLTDVMEFSPPYNECANVVEAKFVESTSDHFVLLVGIGATRRRDGRKAEQRAFLTSPIQPSEFVGVR